MFLTILQLSLTTVSGLKKFPLCYSFTIGTPESSSVSPLSTHPAGHRLILFHFLTQFHFSQCPWRRKSLCLRDSHSFRSLQSKAISSTLRRSPCGSGPGPPSSLPPISSHSSPSATAPLHVGSPASLRAQVH